MNRKILFFALIISLSISLDPPIFPNQYQLHFNETAKIGALSGNTTGVIYYDWTNNRQVITRQSGGHDRYCGTVFKLANTPCNHYVIDNKRFLDFPQKKYCCYCCDNTHGCGIVTRDWMKTANATYQGTEKLDSSDPYIKWSIKGLQTNLYYHKNDTIQTPRRLAQGSDDLMDFTKYSIGISDQSIFKLPSYCTDKCGLTTICAGLRGDQLITEE